MGSKPFLSNSNKNYFSSRGLESEDSQAEQWQMFLNDLFWPVNCLSKRLMIKLNELNVKRVQTMTNFTINFQIKQEVKNNLKTLMDPSWNLKLQPESIPFWLALVHKGSVSCRTIALDCIRLYRCSCFYPFFFKVLVSSKYCSKNAAVDNSQFSVYFNPTIYLHSTNIGMFNTVNCMLMFNIAEVKCIILITMYCIRL